MVNVLMGLAFSEMGAYRNAKSALKNPSVLKGCVSKWKGFAKRKTKKKRVFVRRRLSFSSGPLLAKYSGLE
jgi:hypothetical protein